MSEDYLAQAQPTLNWNTARGVWEKQGMANLLCEHWELFSETWQTSGTMRNGKVYAPQTQAHLTTASEFSSLPTQVFGTPTTATSGRSPEFRQGSNPNPVEFAEDLLPTTRAQNGEDRNNKIYARDPSQPQNLENALAVTLMPTPARTTTNWGKFEPAIRRWERTLGRAAPSPTKPDGKDGAHRLSSKFTEWMMGLPTGWVTDAGLTRNDELKACGNGVVPQQAEMALRSLLGSGTIAGNETQVNLPTPTVSDTYTGNLKSTQQKEGSMHSVTLPQAVGMVADK
jgi:hypothetical protein